MFVRRYNRRAVDDRVDFLPTAVEKAHRLVADLKKQSAEMDAPDSSAEGKQTVENALAAAKSLLKTLEDE